MALAATRSTATTAPDETVALLRQLIAEVRGLREDLRSRRPAPSLSRADLIRLGEMLPAIGGVFGPELFNSAEVYQHPAAALRVACRGLTVKQIGRLLRRAVDIPIGGHMVVREGAEAGAVLWRIVEVPDFPRLENLSVTHARSREPR